MIICISHPGLGLWLRITMRCSTSDDKIVIPHPATLWQWYLVTGVTAIGLDFMVDSFRSHSEIISANRLIWLYCNCVLCPSGAHQDVTWRATEYYTLAESDLPGRIGPAIIGRCSVVDNTTSHSICTIAKGNLQRHYYHLFIRTTRSAGVSNDALAKIDHALLVAASESDER